MFELHPQLIADTTPIGDFPLCKLLLLNDSRFPWCILVPKVAGVTEIHHLQETQRVALMNESCALASTMEALFEPDKMNVAVLGNRVPQLHVHHIARFKKDSAWPGPVWGAGSAKSYTEEQKALIRKQICDGLGEAFLGDLHHRG